MLVSTAWLAQYVSLDGVSPDDLADRLTMAGLEVDAVEARGPRLDGVIVGHVLTTRSHPNADRLTLCEVDLGDDEPVQIVCGAPNVAAGQKVPVAPIGTTLLLPSRKQPGEVEPVTLERAKIRGEVSNGMICAEDELGLSDDHDGIMILPEDAPVGVPLADYLAESGRIERDAVLDVAITPNRPDATSHLGVARDAAAVLGRELTRPDITIPERETEAVAIRIEDEALCRRYVGLVVRGVTVAESPDWLKARLEAIGLRPKNNVVDVTNFVLHEIGQPLHAFDLDRLAGDDAHEAVITVRPARAGERITTLDDRERELPEGALLITDARGPVAVAGVMGGADSEVTDATTDLLIESAYFDPASVRRTAKRLGLATDSSYRFERGVDPEGQAWAAARAARLIAELAGGTIEGLVDAHPNPAERRTVRVRPARVEAVLGTSVSAAKAARLLEAIGFGVAPEGDHLAVTIPSFRPDVEREIDVIEEVARLYGYDRIPLPGRMTLPSIAPRADVRRMRRAEAADRLAGLGFHEVYANSLLPAPVAEAFADASLAGAEIEAVVTANPINREMAALRPSLLPGLLATAAHNQNHGAQTIRLFEFGHVFGRGDAPKAPVSGYREREALGLALAGRAAEPGWDTAEREADFFDLKGVVLHLLAALGIEPSETAETDPDERTVYRLVLHAEGQRLGVVARLDDRLGERAGMRSPLYVAELDWTALGQVVAAQPPTRYASVPRFPAVERDLALLLPASEPVGPMLDTLRRTGGSLLTEVRVFDRYTGERIEAGMQSVAVALRFQSDRTLTDKVVEKQVRRLVQTVEREHGATLRT